MSIATLFGMTKMAAGVAILLCCIGQARDQSIISPERSGGGPPSTRPLSPAPMPSESGAARVYLLHGWMNVFSLGMDDLAQKIDFVFRRPDKVLPIVRRGQDVLQRHTWREEKLRLTNLVSGLLAN